MHTVGREVVALNPVEFLIRAKQKDNFRNSK